MFAVLLLRAACTVAKVTILKFVVSSVSLRHDPHNILSVVPADCFALSSPPPLFCTLLSVNCYRDFLTLYQLKPT
jgi:hypothetical protein